MRPHVASPDAPAGPPALPLAHAQEDSAPDTSREPYAEDLRNLLSAREPWHGAPGAPWDWGRGRHGQPRRLAAFRSYRIELTGAWDWVGQDAFGMVAVADSVTSVLAAGVTYQLVTLGKGPERTTAHVNTVASALPIANSFLVGVSTRYLLMRGARQANAITGDAGILFRPTQGIALGVSGHNLIGTRNPELTRYYSAHAGLVAGLLSIAADVRADFETNASTTFTYSGGLELVLGQSVAARGLHLEWLHPPRSWAWASAC